MSAKVFRLVSVFILLAVTLNACAPATPETVVVTHVVTQVVEKEVE